MFQLFFYSQCVNGMCQAPSSGVCSPTSPGGSCSNTNERVIVAWCCVAEHVDNSERVCSVSMVLAKSVRWLQPLVNCLTMRVGSQSNVAVTALLRVLLRFLISRFVFRLSGTQQPRFVVAAEQCSVLVHESLWCLLVIRSKVCFLSPKKRFFLLLTFCVKKNTRCENGVCVALSATELPCSSVNTQGVCATAGQKCLSNGSGHSCQVRAAHCR